MNIIKEYLVPEAKKLREVLEEALVAELEQFKAAAKVPQTKGNRTINQKEFNAKDGADCFIGQAFKQHFNSYNGFPGREAAEKYRKLVGTMNRCAYGTRSESLHAETLLEHWGAMHWDTHRKMVMNVMRYAFGLRKTMPKIEFHHVFINISL